MALAWVVVANHSHARLFEAENRAGNLREIETLMHPEARLRGQDLESDAPGRTFNSKGQGRHAMENTSSLRRQGADQFAREIVHSLERGRRDQLYEKLYIVADPQMVGSIRQAMDPSTRATIAGETSKNVVTSDNDDIRSALPHWL